MIDYRKNRLVREISLKIDPQIDRFRGLMPFGLCLSADEKTLYVALLGFNAVAVVDLQKRKVKGLIPTGWGTTRVALSKDQSACSSFLQEVWAPGPMVAGVLLYRPKAPMWAIFSWAAYK